MLHQEIPRDRSRHRLDRPLAVRPGLQGLAQGGPPRRPRRHGHPGRARQGARARQAPRRGPLPRLRRALGPPRLQHGQGRRHAARPRRDTPAATINRFCASSAQTTRMAFHAIKAGEGDIFVSAGVECVSQYTDWAGAGGAKRGPAERPLRRRPGPHEAHRRDQRDVDRPPRGRRLLPDIYIAMGQTAENVATAYGICRERQDEWGVTLAEPRRGRHRPWLLRLGDHAGHDARRHRRQQGRRPPRRRHARGRPGAQPGLPRSRAPSRPATAARSTTAPRRSSS